MCECVAASEGFMSLFRFSLFTFFLLFCGYEAVDVFSLSFGFTPSSIRFLVPKVVFVFTFLLLVLF
jgi:hypothetical protein